MRKYGETCRFIFFPNISRVPLPLIRIVGQIFLRNKDDYTRAYTRVVVRKPAIRTHEQFYRASSICAEHSQSLGSRRVRQSGRRNDTYLRYVVSLPQGEERVLSEARALRALELSALATWIR